jgi:hypothetical protein
MMVASSPAWEDHAVQAAVLALVLSLRPDQLTLSELIREMVIESADFAECDAVERAVRDLVGAGLLHRSGELVLPTRAAVHFHRLEAG